MWVLVAVWQPCKLLYICYLLTCYILHVRWTKAKLLTSYFFRILSTKTYSSQFFDSQYRYWQYRERKCAKIYNKWYNKFILLTAIRILVISDHNSCWVLFDKIASVFLKIYFILALEMASPGNLDCANCIGALSFPDCRLAARYLKQSRWLLLSADAVVSRSVHSAATVEYAWEYCGVWWKVWSWC